MTKLLGRDALGHIRDDGVKWTDRAAAIERAIKVLGTGGLVLGLKSVRPLLAALRNRLNDANAKIRFRALHCFKLVANAAMNDPNARSSAWGRLLRPYVRDIAPSSGDSKCEVRESAVAALEGIAQIDSACTDGVITAIALLLSDATAAGASSPSTGASLAPSAGALWDCRVLPRSVHAAAPLRLRRLCAEQ